MPSAGQPIRRLRDLGILLWSGWPGSPWAGAAALPVAPHPNARCSVSAHGLLPPSRICHSQHFSTQSPELKFGARCLCTRYPMRKWNKTKHQGKDKKKKKKVRIYYPDSIFISPQLLTVITPGNQKNEGHYMRDFRERRRLKTKVWGSSTFNDWVIENFKTLHEIGRKI